MEPISVNPILEECQSIYEEIQVLEKKRNQLQAAQRGIGTKIDNVIGQIIPKCDRVNRLITAADALEPDWRSWPWVKEAELDKKFPKK